MINSKYKIVLFSLCLIDMCSGCGEHKINVEFEYLDRAINNLEIDDSIKWIVVLPGLGCNGCIKVAEVFIRNHIENEEIIFVLTSLSSLKILQHKIEVNIKDFSNVYIDKDDKFYIPTKNSIYPCIIRLNDCRIVSYEFQSPANSKAIEKLENQLNYQN